MIDSGAFMIGSKVFTFGHAKKVKQKPRISDTLKKDPKFGVQFNGS